MHHFRYDTEFNKLGLLKQYNAFNSKYNFENLHTVKIFRVTSNLQTELEANCEWDVLE
jgi:hypothetical protein